MKTLCPTTLTTLLLALALGPARVGAAGDPLLTGRDLLGICTDGERFMHGETQDAVAMANAGRCRAYFWGFMDAYGMWGPMDTCPSPRLNSGEILRAAVHWLRNHPAVLAWSRSDAAHAALRGAYPCPAPPPQPPSGGPPPSALQAGKGKP